MGFCRLVYRGFRSSIFGASLPVLEKHFNAPLSTISALLFTHGAGGALSTFVAPVFHKCVDVKLILALSLFVHGSATLLSVVTHFILVAFVNMLFGGLASGTIFNAVYSYVCYLFPEDAYALHLVSTGSPIGLVLGPLVSSYFLDTVPLTNASLEDANLSIISNNNLINLSEESLSPIFYLYALIGLVGVFPITAYFTLFLIQKNKEQLMNTQKRQFIQLDETFTIFKLLFICLIVFLSFCVYGLSGTHGIYITTLAEQGHLKLSFTRASTITSLFWLMSFVGRLLSTGYSFIGNQVTVMYVCLLGATGSSVILVVSMHQEEIYFWIGSLSLGLFCGPLSAALLGWTREYITLTPLVIGLFTSMEYCGATILRYITGLLISWKGESGDIYFCLGLAMCTLLAFLCAHVIGEVKLNK